VLLEFQIKTFSLFPKLRVVLKYLSPSLHHAFHLFRIDFFSSTSFILCSAYILEMSERKLNSIGGKLHKSTQKVEVVGQILIQSMEIVNLRVFCWKGILINNFMISINAISIV
jgi:hypothetical protein